MNAMVNGVGSPRPRLASTRAQDRCHLPANRPVTTSSIGNWIAAAYRYIVRRNPTLLPVIAAALAACGSQSGADAEPGASHPSETRATGGVEMRVARAAHSAVGLADGRVLLIGGCVRDSCDAGPDSSTVDMFDPQRGRFTPGGALLQARVSTTVASLPGGLVLLAGGWAGSTVTAATELFDPRTRRSRAGPALSAAKADQAVATLADGRILLAGGYDGRAAVGSIDLFDPADHSLRQLGTLAVARAGAGAALLPDGRVLVAGGGSNGPAGLRAEASAEIVDPASGMSRHTGSLADARYKHAIVRLPNGKILAIGGSDERDSRGKLDSIESYDPASGRFTIAGRTAARRYKIGSSVVVLGDGRVLIAGGAPRAEIFDPATGKVSTVGPNFGGSLNFATATPIPGKGVLVAGGYYEDGIRMSRRAWLIR